MIWIVGFSLLLFYRSTLCNTVTQSSLDQTVASGSEVTLPCTYDAKYANPDLYWYRRRPGHSFQFILYRYTSVAIDAEFTQGRFSVQYDQIHKTFHLVVSSVTTEDTATYYCAIATTVMQMPRKFMHKPLSTACLSGQLESLDVASFFLVTLCSNWP